MANEHRTEVPANAFDSSAMDQLTALLAQIQGLSSVGELASDPNLQSLHELTDAALSQLHATVRRLAVDAEAAADRLFEQYRAAIGCGVLRAA